MSVKSFFGKEFKRSLERKSFLKAL